MIEIWANERSGVDAGTALCLHIRRLRPGATHRDRSARIPPMKKPRLFAALLLALAAGFALSRYAFAQPTRHSANEGDVAMQRLVHLVSDLTARGDTNTLNQVTSLLAAKDTLSQTRDAGMAVALLYRLRAGRTNEVIQVLETTLDSALTGLGSSRQEIGEAQINTLELAKQYRAKYPRKADAGITRAFELLDRK